MPSPSTSATASGAASPRTGSPCKLGQLGGQQRAGDAPVAVPAGDAAGVELAEQRYGVLPADRRDLVVLADGEAGRGRCARVRRRCSRRSARAWRRATAGRPAGTARHGVRAHAAFRVLDAVGRWRRQPAGLQGRDRRGARRAGSAVPAWRRCRRRRPRRASAGARARAPSSPASSIPSAKPAAQLSGGRRGDDGIDHPAAAMSGSTPLAGPAPRAPVGVDPPTLLDDPLDVPVGTGTRHRLGGPAPCRARRSSPTVSSRPAPRST